MTTNNNSTAGNDTNPKKSWENMSTPGAQPATGDDTKKTGTHPSDPQPKMGNDNQNKKY
ncbi:hypothetical protein H7170_04320 [Candidatus Gracilibacteria bacterium]|nr:hypothetical protein [Candidatus Gracilibacteria bacterium]